MNHLQKRVSLFLGVLAILANGCSDQPDMQQQDMAPAMGTAKLNFKLSDDVRMNLGPAGTTIQGTVYGDLFLAEDVSVIGPSDDAMHFGSVAVKIDLTTAQISADNYVSMPLAPNRYNFLGYFDIGDKTPADNPNPISGDPVTLAVSNRFDVTANQQAAYTVTFDLIYN